MMNRYEIVLDRTFKIVTGKRDKIGDFSTFVECCCNKICRWKLVRKQITFVLVHHSCLLSRTVGKSRESEHEEDNGIHRQENAQGFCSVHVLRVHTSRTHTQTTVPPIFKGCLLTSISIIAFKTILWGPAHRPT